MRVLILIIGWGLAVLASAAEMRIACFSPGATQTIIDLGGGDQIVAATRWCPLPSAHPAQRNCDIFLPDLETLQKLRPTLVILPRMANPLWAEKCAKAGLRTLVLNTESRDSVSKDILRLGEATDRADAAKKITAPLTNRLATTTRKIVVIWDGVMAGPDSYLAEPLAAAGFNSAFTRGAWIKFDWELLVAAKPDAVLWVQNSSSDSPITTCPEKALEMARIPGVRDLSCLKNKHIYQTNSGSNWLPGSGLIKSLDGLIGIRNATGQ